MKVTALVVVTQLRVVSYEEETTEDPAEALQLLEEAVMDDSQLTMDHEETQTNVNVWPMA